MLDRQRLAAAFSRRRRRSPGGAPAAGVTDSFDRDDSALSLGTADSGHVWTAHLGTWGISSNKGYNPSATSSAIATVDSGVVDCTVAVTLSGHLSGAEPGIYVRYVDADNWIRFVQGSDNNVYLQKRIAGVGGTVGSAANVRAEGAVLSVVISGTSVSGRVDGVEKAAGTVADAAVQDSTLHGVGTAGSDNLFRLEDFSVTA